MVEETIFKTKQLHKDYDYLAPDGSEISHDHSNE
jgi:hypothetical protein